MPIRKPIQYHDYLQLDKILEAQKTESLLKDGQPAHDETLFIITHQAYELWFKQILHEIQSVIDLMSQNPIPESQMGLALSRLLRVVEIQKLLLNQVGVLETMTPLDFLDFREFLYPASGFQSYQFRLFESKLGLKNQQRLKYNQADYKNSLKPDQAENMTSIENDKSLKDVIQAWLERTPFVESSEFDFWSKYQTAVSDMFDLEIKYINEQATLTEQTKTENTESILNTKNMFQALFDFDQFEESKKNGNWKFSHNALKSALFIQLYRHLPGLQTPFRIITTLQDIDELLTTWRQRHALMAKRMIGMKIGTGGSSGYQYLKSAAEEHRVFSDFFQLTTYLIPKSALPALPKSIEKSLSFQFE